MSKHHLYSAEDKHGLCKVRRPAKLKVHRDFNIYERVQVPVAEGKACHLLLLAVVDLQLSADDDSIDLGQDRESGAAVQIAPDVAAGDRSLFEDTYRINPQSIP